MITISNEKLKVEISELGAEIQSIIDEKGRECMWNGDPKYWKGRGPILFPICGRLLDEEYIYAGKKYNLGSHGFAKKKTFTVVETTKDSATLSLKEDEETLKMYPFEFELIVRFKLENKKVNVDYTVINTGNKDMYFSIGSHEGYMLEGGIENYYIEFDKNVTLDSYEVVGPIINRNTTRILENSNILPLKNDYFKIDALVFKNIDFNGLTIKKNNGEKVVNVDFSGFPSLLLWMVPGAPYLCVEPWYGIPDSTDTDKIFETKECINVLAPKKEFAITHSFEF